MNEYERDLVCAVRDVSGELKAVLEWLKSHANLATKHDLVEMEKRIVMTQTESAQAIKDITAQIQKIGGETAKTLQKVTDLEALIAAGGDATPEVVQALAEAKAAAQAADDLTPDAPPPTP